MSGILKYICFVVVFLLLSAACNTQKHYQTLSVIFDGVPPPESPQREKTQKETENGKEKLKLFDNENGTTGNVKRKALNRPLSSHPDFQKKRCGKCHSMQHANRIKQRQPELCYQCHKPYETRYLKLHGPVAAGFCNACHTAHQSSHASLLKMPVREVCLHCHDSGDVNKNKAHRSNSERSCMECHNAHGGSTTNFLRKKI